MKISMRLTMDGVTRTLKRLAHEAAERAERERRPAVDEQRPGARQGGDREPGGA